MARVHGQRQRPTSVGAGAGAGAGAARHKKAQQDDQKKPSYKVVIEEISEKKKLKTVLSFNAEAPPGYTFIPAGDPQLTNRCKQLARDDGSKVFIVTMSDPKNPELSHEVHRAGYHFTSTVVENACLSLGVTLTESGRVLQSSFATLNEELPTRHGPKKKSKAKGRASPPRFDLTMSQATIDTQAREAIKDLFPKIPEADLHETVSRSFQKGRNLVGTSSDLSLVRRAHLAVLAHIRHTHTNYDQLLRLVPWAEARRRVEAQTLDRFVSWRDDDDDDTNVMRDVLREVIIISDDEGDEDGHEKEPTMPARKQRRRDSSVEIVSVDNIHMRPLDLAAEPPESENERPIQYIPRRNPNGPQRPHDRLREERQGAHRHQRWEEALGRRKRNPLTFPSTQQPRLAPPESGPIYETPLQTESRHPPRVLQRLDGLPLTSAIGAQRTPQSDASQHHMPLHRADQLHSYVTQPTWHDNSEPSHSIYQMEYPPPQHRVANVQQPEHSQKQYQATRTMTAPATGTRAAQRAPLSALPSASRFVEAQRLGESQDVRYVDVDEPRQQVRQIEKVLPSVENDDSDTRAPMHVPREGVQQYRNPVIGERFVHEYPQHIPYQGTQVHHHFEQPSLKRERDDAVEYVVRRVPGVPPVYDDRGQAVFLRVEGREPHTTSRQRPVEHMYSNEPRVVEHDPRIVRLPSRPQERNQTTHRQVHAGQPPRQKENEPLSDASRAKREVPSYEDRQIFYAKSEQHIPPPVFYRTVDSPHALQSEPHNSLQTSRVPQTLESDPRIVRLDKADDGRFFASPQEISRNIQYFDEQGRAVRSVLRDAAVKYEGPESRGQDVYEQQSRYATRPHRSQASVEVVYETTRPERRIRIEDYGDHPVYNERGEVKGSDQSHQYATQGDSDAKPTIQVVQRRPNNQKMERPQEMQPITVIRRASQDHKRKSPIQMQGRQLQEHIDHPPAYREAAPVYVDKAGHAIQQPYGHGRYFGRPPGKVVVLE